MTRADRCGLRLVADAFSYEQQDVSSWASAYRLLPHAQVAALHTANLEVASDQTVDLLNDAAWLLRNRADYIAAKDILEKVLAIDEAAYGESHPSVAIYVNNLGSVLKDLGELVEARAHYERALNIFEQWLGPDHPNTHIVRGHLEALPE